jgi:hypothetical protein
LPDLPANGILPVMVENELSVSTLPVNIHNENHFRKISLAIAKASLAIVLRLPAFSICPLDDVIYFLTATNASSVEMDKAILYESPDVTIVVSDKKGKDVLLPQPPLGVL